MRNAKGFTMVELMIALAVSAGLLAAVYMAINSTQRHSSSIERRVTAQQDVKPALDIMAMEIGMASYNPTFASNLWVVPSGTCLGAAANQTYRGIQVATANAIAVEMDIAGDGTDGDGMLGDDNEVIRYNYNTANQYITREVSCKGGAQPFLGDTVAGHKTVRVINSTAGPGNTAIPVFRYFNGVGAEIAAGSLPAAIPDIRRIEIVLAVETEGVDANTGQRKRLIYSTSVIPRNHAIQ
jgi:prepilin-type N-terminal cleavage/methylation domain-containing protein